MKQSGDCITVGWFPQISTDQNHRLSQIFLNQSFRIFFLIALLFLHRQIHRYLDYCAQKGIGHWSSVIGQPFFSSVFGLPTYFPHITFPKTLKFTTFAANRSRTECLII